MRKEVKNNYYFKNQASKNEKKLLNSEKEVWDSLDNLEKFLNDRLVNDVIKENKGTILENVVLTGCYHIGKNTVIHPNVVINGPVFIGDNVTIMPHALIRPFTFIADNVTIGHAAEIKHSIISSNAKVQSFSFVGDSILGFSSRVGSGSILSNRRFDQKAIVVNLKDEKITLDTSFFGCVLGDHSRIGAGCTVQPGTLIGPYSFIYPSTNARGFIKEAVKVYETKQLVMKEKEKQDLL